MVSASVSDGAMFQSQLCPCPLLLESLVGIACRNRSSGALVSLVDGEESTCEGRSTEK